MISQEQFNYVLTALGAVIAYFLKLVHKKINETSVVAYEAINHINILKVQLESQDTRLEENNITARELTEAVHKLETICTRLSEIISQIKEDRK
ncbi:hypothetical protein AB3N59_20285 (plasmid) [Leptospira sp. WS92.C1]